VPSPPMAMGPPRRASRMKLPMAKWGVNGEEGADEGEAAGDDGVERRVPVMIGGAEEFGGAFAFAVAEDGREQSGEPWWVSGMWVMSGVGAVHRAGTGEEETVAPEARAKSRTARVPVTMVSKVATGSSWPTESMAAWMTKGNWPECPGGSWGGCGRGRGGGRHHGRSKWRDGRRGRGLCAKAVGSRVRTVMCAPRSRRSPAKAKDRGASGRRSRCRR